LPPTDATEEGSNISSLGLDRDKMKRKDSHVQTSRGALLPEATFWPGSWYTHSYISNIIQSVYARLIRLTIFREHHDCLCICISNHHDCVYLYSVVLQVAIETLGCQVAFEWIVLAAAQAFGLRSKESGGASWSRLLECARRNLSDRHTHTKEVKITFPTFLRSEFGCAIECHFFFDLAFLGYLRCIISTIKFYCTSCPIHLGIWVKGRSRLSSLFRSSRTVTVVLPV
jgi:hypothetical protein